MDGLPEEEASCFRRGVAPLLSASTRESNGFSVERKAREMEGKEPKGRDSDLLTIKKNLSCPKLFWQTFRIVPEQMGRERELMIHPTLKPNGGGGGFSPPWMLL